MMIRIFTSFPRKIIIVFRRHRVSPQKFFSSFYEMRCWSYHYYYYFWFAALLPMNKTFRVKPEKCVEIASQLNVCCTRQ
jgi:hypothetical protein